MSELNFNSDENVFFKDLPWAKRDPFRHPSFEVKKDKDKAIEDDKMRSLDVSEGGKPPKLDLSAIIYSEKSSSAVINGRIVKEGSIIKKQRLLKINKDNIEVEFYGKTFKIVLKDLTVSDEDK